MLTRKVFEEQAAIIKKHLPKVGAAFSYEMATDLADYFERENPRFDRPRFFDACGLGGVHFRPLPVHLGVADGAARVTELYWRAKCLSDNGLWPVGLPDRP